MRSLSTHVPVFVSFFLVFSGFPQETATKGTQPGRDLQAIAMLRQSAAAMAQSVPSDSSATGTVTIVEGSSTDSGTIRILTRGAEETAEMMSLVSGQRAIIYSHGDAKEVTGTQSTNPPLELSVSDECPDFPLFVVTSMLNNPDEALRYVGSEILSGVSVQHVQAWNSFASRPRLQKLAPFSTKDIWFDTSSGLPLKIAYSRRAAVGAEPAIPVEVFFSNYTSVLGVQYPFQINKSFNGTPWQTIAIQKVSFNTGLTEAEFQIE